MANTATVSYTPAGLVLGNMIPADASAMRLGLEILTGLTAEAEPLPEPCFDLDELRRRNNAARRKFSN